MHLKINAFRSVASYGSPAQSLLQLLLVFQQLLIAEIIDGGCEKPNYANNQQAHDQKQRYGPKILIHTITRLLS